MIMNIPKEIAEASSSLSQLPRVIKWALIGSALYMAHAADVDFIVLVNDDAIKYAQELVETGWARCCGDYDNRDMSWTSIRRGNVNLMITHDSAFYGRYERAMQVCKYLQLTNKGDRVAVCQIVRDGRLADECDPRGQS